MPKLMNFLKNTNKILLIEVKISILKDFFDVKKMKKLLTLL